MQLIALGWSRAGEILPAPMFPLCQGAVALICAGLEGLASPRARLSLLQSLYDARIDHVPLPPDQEVPVPQAVSIADRAEDHIQRLLTDLSGRGQIFVRASWSESVVSEAAESGRSWLRMRGEALSRQTARQELAASLFDSLLADLGPRTRIVHTDRASSISVLVDRDSAAHILHTIDRIGRDIPAVKGLSISVSGPWSPIAFAHLPTPRMEMAA